MPTPGRFIPTLLLGGVLAFTASATEPAHPAAVAPAETPGPTTVPAWAQSWREKYLQTAKDGSLKLRVRSLATVPTGKSDVWVVVDVSSVSFPSTDAPPSNVALVLDQSMSMKGTRLEAVKHAAKDVLKQLNEKDRLTIIRTSTGVDTFKSLPVSPDNRVKMEAFIDDMEAGGSTDISAGFEAAVAQLDPLRDTFESNEVVVISDGHFTHGINDPAGLGLIAKEARDKKKIHSSGVAIGDDAEQEMMSTLARDGWGLFDFITDASRVPRIGHRLRLPFTRRAAEKAELVLKLSADVSLADVLLHDEFREGSVARIPLYEIGSGEDLRVIFRMVVNAARPRSDLKLGTVELDYEDHVTDQHRAQTSPLQVSITAGNNKLEPDSAAIMEIAAHELVRRNLVLAQGAYLEGEKGVAIKLLDETLGFLRRSSGISEDELTRDTATVTELRNKWEPPKKTPPKKRRPT